MSDGDVGARLAAIGAPLSRDLLNAARGHLLRARAEAWRRTERVFGPAALDAANPLRAMLALDAAPPAPTVPPAAYATERLTDMIAKAGSVLTPEQRAVSTDADRIIRQFGVGRDDHER